MSSAGCTFPMYAVSDSCARSSGLGWLSARSVFHLSIMSRKMSWVPSPSPHIFATSASALPLEIGLFDLRRSGSGFPASGSAGAALGSAAYSACLDKETPGSPPNANDSSSICSNVFLTGTSIMGAPSSSVPGGAPKHAES